MQSVRSDAPWCPSNIEFIRRINGLDSIEEVRRIVFDASYLVMGLGDVYLGAPVATPLDPRHRLVTTKYNPARTGPRQERRRHRRLLSSGPWHGGPGATSSSGARCRCGTASAAAGTSSAPGCCASSIQIRFYPVSEQECWDCARHPPGGFRLKVEETRFSLRDYEGFLAANAGPIADFKGRQQAAFEAERERWAAAGQGDLASQVGEVIDQRAAEPDLAPGERRWRGRSTAASGACGGSPAIASPRVRSCWSWSP